MNAASVRKMVVPLAISWALPPACAGATGVYVSVALDGSTRYASQALDPSYRPILSETNGGPLSRPRASGMRLLIDGIAARHGLDPALIEAVVAVESGYNPRAVSAKGARGAMQLMPATAKRYGLHNPQQLADPEQNIDAGVRHLKELLELHAGNVALALAAYNAGPAAVRRHGARIPPYRETMLYVPSVLARSATAPR